MYKSILKAQHQQYAIIVVKGEQIMAYNLLQRFSRKARCLWYNLGMRIKGTVKNIIFRSDDTGFTVLELTDDSGDEITAVGAMPTAAVGERIELSGEWTEHRSYGMQFRADEYSTLAPATLGAITSYLGCGIIKGVGPETARNIVATFGMDTLFVLENQPERLSEVYGIGRVRAAAIADSYMAQRELRDIMIGLQEYGITVNQAMKLYKIYGAKCLEKLKENPYRLVDDVEGIGFKTADKIAVSGGFAPDSPFRLRAGLRYTLQWACREGHTYLPREKLIQVAADILSEDIGPVERELDELIIGEQVTYKTVNGTDACFLPYLYKMESECAARLNLMASQRNKPSPYFNIDSQTEQLEVQYNISLAPEQRKAVRLALSSGVLVITGGPGTGKTTILQFVISMLDKLGESFELCAPTGRAAKRMTEATGCEARTIHRLLEYGFGESSFTRNHDNPIDTDVIVVDEVSMVDVQLLWALLRATRAGTRLILVGDADQLPSVGAGNVLRDIIASDAVPVVRLTDIYRQGGRSAIVTNAHRINNGQPPILHGEEEFGFEAIDSAEDILRRLTALCSGKSNKLYGLDPLKDIQVLSPMKKGALGVRNINLRLQAALNPPAHKKHERQYGETVFREGDKVMQVKNDYRMGWKRARKGRPDELGEGVYNGDLGTIMAIDLYDQTVDVLFDDEREAIYEFSHLEELELAYCISIHKSQGSEFPAVLLPLAGGPPMLMTRNLLYTAVTRARKTVYIIGHEECPAEMVANNQVKKRYSALSAFLRLNRGLQ